MITYFLPKISLNAPAREKDTAEEVLHPDGIQPTLAVLPKSSPIVSRRGVTSKNPVPTGADIARPRNYLLSVVIAHIFTWLL
jgi:hypothetical protein